ncbi:MAG: glutamate--cysteine ligase [Deltaproteobacteria bacterium]|nr:glutamate--cysteine ligase [Deltaproteobacteria bacterium]
MAVALDPAWLRTPLGPSADAEALLPELTAIFRRSERKGPLLLGLEQEKVSYRLDDGGPVPYFGKHGIHRLLLELCARFGWQPEYTEGFLLSLSRGAAKITLEPGGQVELSGSPLTDLLQVQRELTEHIDEVVSIGDDLGIGFSTLGFHPLRNPDDIEFVPKPRYPIMRRYFRSAGTRGRYMMANTATVQVNLDFASEADALEKIRAGQRASPYVTAIFANAPFEHGKDTGWASRRYFTWLDVDNTRAGLLPFLERDDAGYETYARWGLQAPMFGIHRDDLFIPAPPISFQAFLTAGYAGAQPNQEDWYDHLGTLFPEVRIKRTIELRGADSGGIAHSLAVAGMWRGLLDDPDTRRRLLCELPPLDALPEAGGPRALQRIVAERGLQGVFGGERIIDVAARLVVLARRGLYALSDPLAGSVLDPVMAALDDGLTPAALLSRQLGKKTGKALLDATRYSRR